MVQRVANTVAKKSDKKLVIWQIHSVTWRDKLCDKHKIMTLNTKNLAFWEFFFIFLERNYNETELPSCDTNFATRDRSFWSIFKCLLHFFWRNRKRFLNGTNAILKFDNLASRCNFFRFLFALQLFLINF